MQLSALDNSFSSNYTEKSLNSAWVTPNSCFFSGYLKLHLAGFPPTSLSKALHTCVIFFSVCCQHPEVISSLLLFQQIPESPHLLYNCNLFLPSSPRPFIPPLSFRGSRNGLLSLWNQLLKNTVSYLINSHFFLYFFLRHHCKLALSLHLPHLKLRFPKYPYVSQGDLFSLPLTFPAYCRCSAKDQSTERPLPLGSHTSVIGLPPKLQNCLSRLD